MSLNLFPARVPTGSVTLPDGTVLDVLMTPEFARALRGLLERVGGENGSSSTDIEALTMEALITVPDQAPELQPPEVAPEIALIMSELAQLRQQVQVLLQSTAGPQSGGISNSDAEQYAFAMAAPTPIDWERPGKIGFKVPNYGAFTTLTASAAVTFSPASANVVLSPTGTGVVTISPATAGTMENVDIGAATPKTVKSTALTATGAVSLSPANANVVLSPTGTGVVTINPATVGALDNVTIGAGTPKPITGTTLDGTELTTTGAFSLFNGLLRSSGTTGMQFDGASTAANAEAFFENTDAVFILHASSSGAVVKTLDFCATGAATVHFRVANTGTTTTGTHTVSGGFGCNTKAAQTAFASGGALAAYGAGANGLDTGANMSALHAMVVAIRAALVANGIMS